MDTWTLELPYRRPPLTLNQRMHYMAEYRVKEQLKADAILLAKVGKLPRLRAITAQLDWYKGDNRKADPDNIAPTLKPVLDGLVAAGVLPEDDAAHVFHTASKVIYLRDDPHPLRGSRLWVTVRDMSMLAASNLPGFQR